MHLGNHVPKPPNIKLNKVNAKTITTAAAAAAAAERSVCMRVRKHGCDHEDVLLFAR